jgi:hypothetical protein
MNLLKEDFESLTESDCFILASISNNTSNIMTIIGNNSQQKHTNY